MDKSWINAHIKSTTYRKGVESFIDFARARDIRGSIICPCLRCCNDELLEVEEVHDRLLRYGFLPGYTIWAIHGELATPPTSQSTSVHETSFVKDDMIGFVRDAFGLSSSPLNHENTKNYISAKTKHKRSPNRIEVFDLSYQSRDGSYVHGMSKDFMERAREEMTRRELEISKSRPVDDEVRAEIADAVMMDLKGPDKSGQALTSKMVLEIPTLIHLPFNYESKDLHNESKEAGDIGSPCPRPLSPLKYPQLWPLIQIKNEVVETHLIIH
nr:tetratricopeptide-like helical domain, DYW domain protein [Tanacetum cinerariifolium]